MTSYTSVSIVTTLLISFIVLTAGAQKKQTGEDMMVRIAEIEVYPEHLKQYKEILKEEAAASIAKEPGVIAIFPMFEQQDSARIRIVEIYAGKQAYQAHLKTPHFLVYKTSTQKMVKQLRLVDMEALDKQSMLQIFRKLK